MALIELKNITFQYEDDDESVIRDFSMSIEKGEFIHLTGENGSGKTTLLKILNGLIFPLKGEYTFDGEPVTESVLKDTVKLKSFHKKIGFLFQNSDVMLFNSRVYDEVAFGPRQMGLSEEEVNQRTNDCLALLGIEHLSDKAPYHLSGGQKKRVAIASMLSLNPDVLILDEPFNDLDDSGVALVNGLISDLNNAGKTIIYVGHGDVAFVSRSVPVSRFREINLSKS